MKKFNAAIKTTIAVTLCFSLSIAGFSQTNGGNFDGWSVSFHTGAASTGSILHWNSAITVNQVTNINGPGGVLTIVPATLVTPPDSSMHNTGFAASLRVGYKKTFGHFLVGAEAGFGINSFKASEIATFYPETMLQARNPLTIQRTISSGLSKMLEAKFGYTKGNHFVYGIAGITLNPVTVISSDYYQLSPQNKHAVGTAVATGSYNYTSVASEQKQVHTLMGISLGAGYQYMVSEGVSIGIEYRQTSFGKGTYTTEKVTGEQPTDAAGTKVGFGGGIEASHISVNMKQQALTVKVDVALSVLSAIFKK